MVWFGCRSQNDQFSALKGVCTRKFTDAFRFSVFFVRDSDPRGLKYKILICSCFSHCKTTFKAPIFEVHLQGLWALDVAPHQTSYLSWTWCWGETLLYSESWPRVSGWQSDDCWGDEKTHHLAAADPSLSWVRCFKATKPGTHSHIGPKPRAALHHHHWR